MKKQQINNEERRQWILNDEGLYNMFRSTHRSETSFIKAYREEIDAVINNITSGNKQSHYLAY